MSLIKLRLFCIVFLLLCSSFFCTFSSAVKTEKTFLEEAIQNNGEDQELQSLERYLLDFMSRFETAENKQEIVSLCNEAVFVIHSYGLVPKGFSVQQAQNLVTRQFRDQDEIAQNKILGGTNRNCLVASLTTYTYPLGLFGFIPGLPFILLPIYYHILPFQFVGPVVFGVEHMWTRGWDSYPSEGLLLAKGPEGFMNAFSFFGNLRYGCGLFTDYYYVGMNTFTGLTIRLPGKAFLLGYTPLISLSEDVMKKSLE